MKCAQIFISRVDMKSHIWKVSQLSGSSKVIIMPTHQMSVLSIKLHELKSNLKNLQSTNLVDKKR